jgi:hypothetical protein
MQFVLMEACSCITVSIYGGYVGTSIRDWRADSISLASSILGLPGVNPLSL